MSNKEESEPPAKRSCTADSNSVSDSGLSRDKLSLDFSNAQPSSRKVIVTPEVLFSPDLERILLDTAKGEFQAHYN